MDELTKRALRKGNIEMQINVSGHVAKSSREKKGRHLLQIQKSVRVMRVDMGEKKL